MIDTKITLKMYKYSDEILEIIERKDEFDQSDLQGAVQAVILKILNDKK